MSSPSKRPNDGAVGLAIFILSVALNLGYSLVGFRNSPMEIHEFRQLQTALSARTIQESGWRLAYQTPLFGPPWSVPMEFPIYEFCAAKVASLTGLPIEPAARLTALGFLYLTLPACFGLLGLLGVPRPRRWLLLTPVLLSPIFLYYSRTIMIESTAVCAAAWFLLAYCRALERTANRWLLAAMPLCGVAALAKVTTLIVFLVVAALYTLALLWQQWRTGKDRWVSVRTTALRALAITIPGVVIGYAWVRYSDAIKVSNPLSDFLASGPMTPFNFGSVKQRLTAEFWKRIQYYTSTSVLSSFNYALVVIFAVLGGSNSRKRSLLLLAGFLAGPLIFANLYFVHDYYFYASALFLLGALALAWNQLLDAPVFTRGAKWLIIGLSLLLQFTNFLQGYYYIQQRPMDEAPDVATALAAATEPNDVLLIYGRDWDSKISYFSHRRTVMVIGPKVDSPSAVDNVLNRLEPGRVTALVVTGQMREYPNFFQPLIQRLKLHPTALLVSSDTTIYLAESRLVKATALLEVMPLKTLSFTAPPETSSGLPRLRFFEAAIASHKSTTMMSPQPFCIVHPFGLASHALEEKTVFNAHAPTDVLFNLPASVTEAYAEFGILPSAYTGQNSTEGVEFRVDHVDQAGRHRTLSTIYLSPSKRPEDRGEKNLRIPIPAGLTGQIWFRTLPGPTGSINCAWAYWARIELR